VGFDSDSPNVFDHQADFIEAAAIPTSMINLLTAAPDTRLYRRLEAEGRLLGDSDGDTAMNAGSLNFIPKMGRHRLLDGYKNLLDRLFSPEPYYQRVLTFLEHFRPNPLLPARFPTHRERLAFLKILFKLGFMEPGRRAFWSFLGRLLWRHPQSLPLGITIAAQGFHYRIITHRFSAALQEPAPRMFAAADLQEEPLLCLDQPQNLPGAKAWPSEDVDRPGEMKINRPLSDKSAILIQAGAAEK
jgi:hypothetical protein